MMQNHVKQTVSSAMKPTCNLVIGAALCATSAALPRHCAAVELTETEVDRLCPPRPETAAEFREGVYPPAARPYREAALKAFAYMASLPAMRTLVETGVPEQTYQHNAYVAKTQDRRSVRDHSDQITFRSVIVRLVLVFLDLQTWLCHTWRICQCQIPLGGCRLGWNYLDLSWSSFRMIP